MQGECIVLGHISLSDLERFWAKIVILGPDDCWLWQAGRDKDGYGLFHCLNKQWRSTRFLWLMEFDDALHKNIFLCHHCDNPPCCNPNHLFLGSALINNRDAASKGRYTASLRKRVLEQPESFLRGEAMTRAKLRAFQIVEMRQLFASGKTIRTIQKMFPFVTWECVAAIVKNRTWKHVKALT